MTEPSESSGVGPSQGNLSAPPPPDDATKKREAVVIASVMTAMTLMAWLLWLNVRERDIYDTALPGPPAGPINRDPPGFMPGDAQFTESLLAIRVDDADGWYRLFWAGTDHYWYDDPAHFGAALINRTTAGWEGRWSIKGTLKGAPFELLYVLREGAQSAGEAGAGPLKVPSAFFWCSRRWGADEREFWWVLQRP